MTAHDEDISGRQVFQHWLSWMKELGLTMTISELGATDDMIEGIADATLILDGGYKVLDRDEVVGILKASM